MGTAKRHKGHEKAAHRDVEFIKHLAEELHLLLHFVTAFIPEAGLIRLFERNRRSLLERRHTAIADPSVSASDVLDQMLWADEVAHTPTSGVKGLSSGTDSQSALI